MSLVLVATIAGGVGVLLGSLITLLLTRHGDVVEQELLELPEDEPVPVWKSGPQVIMVGNKALNAGLIESITWDQQIIVTMVSGQFWDPDGDLDRMHELIEEWKEKL